MAMPQPQADNRFPGRTALQPPVPLSAPAGSEKTPPDESELKKPIPAIDRPAPKTSFAAAVSATSPIASTLPPATKLAAVTAAVKTEGKESAGEKPDASAKPDSSPALDWGLSPSKKRRGTKLKIGVAAAALVCAAGGYVAYSQFFGKTTAVEGPAPEAGEVTQSEEPGRLEPAAGAPEGGDPFDDIPAVSSRSSATSEPRRIGGNPDDAAPIGRRGAAADRPRKNPLQESLDLDGDDPPELSEDNRSSRRPAKRRTENPASGPALDEPADSLGARPAAGRSASGSLRSRGSSAASGSGPRLAAGGGDDDLADDLAEEKLDGYSVADKRTAVSAKGTAGGPAISIIEAHDDAEGDDKLDGYVPQDVTSHRARSRTLVVRSADGDSRPTTASAPNYPKAGGNAPSRSTTFSDDEIFDGAPGDVSEDHDEPFARPARDEVGTLQRRSSPPVAAADRRLTATPPAAGIGAQSGGPASDTYRVAPDDSFWMISRKQYGTARYYQALMRYNQDRVPDPQKLRPGSQILTPPASVLEQRFPDLIEKPASGSAASNGASDRTVRRPGFEKPFAVDDADETATPSPRGTASSGYFYGKSGQPLYRIGPDDTLTGIAQRHLGRASRWQEIYESNQDVLQSPDNLAPGTVIRLPADASRVSLAPDSDRRR